MPASAPAFPTPQILDRFPGQAGHVSDPGVVGDGIEQALGDTQAFLSAALLDTLLKTSLQSALLGKRDRTTLVLNEYLATLLVIELLIGQAAFVGDAKSVLGLRKRMLCSLMVAG